MAEQSSGFLSNFGKKDQYIDPKYRKQIEDWEKNQNLEKGRRIAGAMREVETGHLVKGLAKSLGVASDIREEIKAGDTSSFPYLLGLAILTDIIVFVPVVGLIVKFVAKPILIYGTLFRGRMVYKWKIRIVFIVLSSVELVPVVDWLPLETLSILLLWRATAKIRKEKEAEEEENNQIIKSLGQKLKRKNQTIGQEVQNSLAIIEQEVETGVRTQPEINNQSEYAKAS